MSALPNPSTNILPDLCTSAIPAAGVPVQRVRRRTLFLTCRLYCRERYRLLSRDCPERSNAVKMLRSAQRSKENGEVSRVIRTRRYPRFMLPYDNVITVNGVTRKDSVYHRTPGSDAANAEFVDNAMLLFRLVLFIRHLVHPVDYALLCIRNDV